MAGKGKDKRGEGGEDNDDSCVLHSELHDFMQQLTDQLVQNQAETSKQMEALQRQISGITDRLQAVETRLPPAANPPPRNDQDQEREDDASDDDEDEEDDDVHHAERRRFGRQPRQNRQQRRNGGRQQRRPAPAPRDDPFAKVKFSIPSFSGAYDAEAYLDWEMIVDQKFSSHLVPEQHRVRQDTSEFKDFALIWWNELVKARTDPQTWDRLKEAMRARFVPPSYKRDLRKKLQRLDQGNMSVQEYYQQLQKGMLRCGVEEEDEDKMVRFYGGLNPEIQNIIDYKEYNSIQRLFHLAMLAEKELQGRQDFRSRSTSTSTKQAAGSSKYTPSSTRAAAPSATPNSTRMSNVPPTTDSNIKPSSNQGVAATKGVSSNPSSSRTSNIKCHRCQGIGHVQRDCPSKRAYIATADGGYVSTSDVEDEPIAAANIAGDEDDSTEEILDAHATETYRTLIVHRALSAQVQPDDKIQRHNLFHSFFVVNDCRLLTIIDSGSCNNLVSADAVKKLGLSTRPHSHPYHIQWFNNTGKVKVTETARVRFSIGSYHDFADCDVVPMDACSLLLGRPWEFDTDALHHGRSNNYTLMHKGKKITLIPMTPAEIVKYEQDKLAKAKGKGAAPTETQPCIKLKKPSFLATKTDLAALDDDPQFCYALVCT